jgi:hypothetical protein
METVYRLGLCFADLKSRRFSLCGAAAVVGDFACSVLQGVLYMFIVTSRAFPCLKFFFPSDTLAHGKNLNDG